MTRYSKHQNSRRKSQYEVFMTLIITFFLSWAFSAPGCRPQILNKKLCTETLEKRKNSQRQRNCNYHKTISEDMSEDRIKMRPCKWWFHMIYSKFSDVWISFDIFNVKRTRQQGTPRHSGTFSSKSCKAKWLRSNLGLRTAVTPLPVIFRVTSGSDIWKHKNTKSIRLTT